MIDAELARGLAAGGILALVFLGVPALGVFALVAKHTSPAPLIGRLREGHPVFRQLPADIRQFQEAHGLAQVEVMQYGQIPFALYREPPGPPPSRCMVVMHAGGRYVSEFCTQFSGHESLTTTRSASAFALPRPPGSHIQGFMNLSLELLWARHLEGELYLLDQRKIAVTPLPAELQDAVFLIERELREQGKFIKAVPLYLLKAPWWFYVRRHRMVNKTLAQQAATGIRHA